MNDRDLSAAGAAIQLRLYVARFTPNSVRAERELMLALKGFPEVDGFFALEVIDVFTQQKRAVADGVIVTPTLIGLKGRLRRTMLGDLSSPGELSTFLEGLRT